MGIIEFLLWSAAILFVALVAGALVVTFKKEMRKVDDEE